MRVLSCETPAEFEIAAGEWLAREPRRNNLILSILRRTTEFPENTRGWVISSDGGPQIALLQAPPHHASISDGTTEAAQFAARFLPADLPGIAGPSAVADAFSSAWCARTKGGARLHWEMTLYTLDRVEPFLSPSGSLERATLADLDALRPLIIAAAVAMNFPSADQNPEELEKRLRRTIAGDRQFIWKEGSSIQAIASYGESLGGAGARIGLVYTRPELRGQGYGSAITGSLAQFLLNQGQAWVSLFADISNPVSNRIYQRLGFRAELAYRTWLFD